MYSRPSYSASAISTNIAVSVKGDIQDDTFGDISREQHKGETRLREIVEPLLVRASKCAGRAQLPAWARGAYSRWQASNFNCEQRPAVLLSQVALQRAGRQESVPQRALHREYPRPATSPVRRFPSWGQSVFGPSRFV
jgi:hypothetical protein